MRDPNSKNPNQQSVYIMPSDWEAARTLAHMAGTTISGLIVRLIQRERARVLRKKKVP